tara:strand:+ start:1440 stop:2441 length:1002 start_codon:yes stop_codon:yes gene_type:complete
MTMEIVGNDAQFNEKVTLLKDLEIYGNIKNKKKDISFDFSDDFSFKLQDNEKLNIANNNISFKTELNIKISNSYDVDDNGTVQSKDSLFWSRGRFPPTVAIENSVKTAGIYLGDGDIFRESAINPQLSGGFGIFGRNSTYDYADNFISGMPFTGIRVGYSTGGTDLSPETGLTILKTKHDGNGIPATMLKIDVDDDLTFFGENIKVGTGVTIASNGDATYTGIVTASNTPKAFVNFDGTTNTGGNCTIRDSLNVSSVADNGTGHYTINFSTAFANTNYIMTFGHSNEPHNSSTHGIIYTETIATGSLEILNFNDLNSNDRVDKEMISAVIHAT